MAGLLADDRGIRLPCAKCKRVNRIPYSKLTEEGKCGGCAAPLPAPNAPVEVPDTAAYDALLSKSPLPVLVDYWAEWCGPCRSVAPELVKVAAAWAGRLILAKVNTEALPDVAQRERIMSIPTMAVFRGGGRLTEVSGARPAHEIEALLRQALGSG